MAGSFRYLGLEDYLLLAEALLEHPAEHLARLPRIGGAESALLAPQAVVYGEEQYPELASKAAILCVRQTCLSEAVITDEHEPDPVVERILAETAGQAREQPGEELTRCGRTSLRPAGSLPAGIRP